MSKKRKKNKIVARSKRGWPTRRRAMDSLERVGILPHMLGTPRHTGTYWRWELRETAK